MKTKQSLVYVAIVIALSMASKSFAHWEKCDDESRKSCTKISKGDAVREAATNPNTVIYEIQKKKLSEKGTMVKAD